METSSADTGSSQHDHLGAQRERAGDADALALAAGELVRVAVGEVGVEADDVEQVLHLLAAVALRGHLGVDLERLADDVADRHARVERGVRVLQHDLDLPAQRLEVLPAPAEHVLAVEPHRARRRRLQPHQHLRQWSTCRSPTRRRAPSVSPLSRVEADAVDGLARARLCASPPRRRGRGSA
jgi:hypothetical protein